MDNVVPYKKSGTSVTNQGRSNAIVCLHRLDMTRSGQFRAKTSTLDPVINVHLTPSRCHGLLDTRHFMQQFGGPFLLLQPTLHDSSLPYCHGAAVGRLDCNYGQGSSMWPNSAVQGSMHYLYSLAKHRLQSTGYMPKFIAAVAGRKHESIGS